MEFSPQFKAWFGSSLVTDAEDNPLRVYHGSNRLEDISIFKSEYNNGYYFTSDPNYAVEYSGTTNIGAKTIPVYLRLEHPMDFFEFRDIVRAARKDGSDPVKKTIKLGYDGVITDKAHEFGCLDVKNTPKTFIVFSPNQIKSAIGNKGTYNREDPNITESKELFSIFKESKAFRNDSMVEKYSVKELSEILFAMMLTLHLIGVTEQSKKYCHNSLKFPKFNHIFLSSTDLANAITTLVHAKEYLDKPNVDVPVNELKRYLRGIILGTNTDQFSRAFFFRLQTKLRIKDSLLSTLRREIVDGKIQKNKNKLAVQLYQYLRKYNNCDLLVVLQSLLDESLTESKKHIASESEIRAYMEILKQKYIESEGSLDGMCYDACLDMQRKFPQLHWFKGMVEIYNGKRYSWVSHSWMVSDDGTIYDPTVSQFKDVPSYEFDGDKCLVQRIDGKQGKLFKSLEAANNSKSITESVNPSQMIYHGTFAPRAKQILQTKFLNPSLADTYEYGKAVWFTSDLEDACEYAGNAGVVFMMPEETSKQFRCKRIVYRDPSTKVVELTVLVKEPIPLKLVKYERASVLRKTYVSKYI